MLEINNQIRKRGIKMKKVFSIILIAVMIITVSTPVFANNEYLKKLEEAGLIEKLEERERLQEAVTRGEVVELVAKLLAPKEELPMDAKEIYPDISKENPLNKYVNILADKELIGGYLDGTFKPNKDITYGELVTIILKALGEKINEGNWPQNYIERAIELRLISDIEDFNKAATREDAYKMLYQVFDRMKIKVSMVTDLGGIDDEGFNQMAWEGLQRAKSQWDIEIKYIQPEQQSDFEKSLDILTKENNDLIFGVGFMLTDSILEQAKINPNHKYVLIDSLTREIPDNLMCVLFNHEEGAFLAGYIAGKMTKTNKIGFVGGIEIPIVDSFEYGYRAGALYANPDIKIITKYTDSFADFDRGKDVAHGMYRDKIDIIFHAAGMAGEGVIEAAKENNKYAIGIDRDQNYLAPDNVITSVVKNIDKAVVNIAREFNGNDFKGGQKVHYGVKEDGMGLASSTEKLVPKEIMEEIEEIKEKISKGEIIVPKTEEEFLELEK